MGPFQGATGRARLLRGPTGNTGPPAARPGHLAQLALSVANHYRSQGFTPTGAPGHMRSFAGVGPYGFYPLNLAVVPRSPREMFVVNRYPSKLNETPDPLHRTLGPSSPTHSTWPAQIYGLIFIAISVLGLPLVLYSRLLMSSAAISKSSLWLYPMVCR